MVTSIMLLSNITTLSTRVGSKVTSSYGRNDSDSSDGDSSDGDSSDGDTCAM